MALVTTTIYVPRALERYLQNAARFGHRRLLLVVSGDRKTPRETGEFMDELQREFPEARVAYLDAAAQETYLQRYPELGASLPWNCIQRRNIAFLYAYEQGVDALITIDDDNFIVSDDEDFVGRHLRVLRPLDVAVLASADGWFNVCEFLREERGIPFYHRGYPMDQRWVARAADAVSESVRAGATCAVSAGLWLGDPDIDAMARLCLPINAVEYTRGGAFALDASTWSPFNSQNTAVRADLLPAYFMSWRVGRYDDIWPSYVVRRIADHLGHLVVYGTPVVRQERNPHNYYVDFDNERMGMQATPAFVAMLKDVTLRGASYKDCFAEIIEQLPARIDGAQYAGLNDAHRAFLRGLHETMVVWQATIARCDALRASSGVGR